MESPDNFEPNNGLSAETELSDAGSIPARLTILIPTITTRKHLFNRLKEVLYHQCNTYNALILVDEDQGYSNGGKHIGEKRNALIDACKTEYCAFVDDDDTVSSDYVARVMEGIAKGVDVITFKGIISSDGKKVEEFIHKIGLNWEDQRGVYRRPPNHLNPMKTEIMRQIRFPEGSHEFGNADWGEDKDFSMRLKKSGLLKTEHFINQHLYYYQYRSKK